MKEAITTSINKALKEVFDIEGVDFVVEDTKELSHGDMASNVALVAFEGRRKFEKAIDGDSDTINLKYGVEVTNPKQFAEKIVEYLKNKNIENISDISIAGPGFINFHFSKEFFINTLSQIDGKWGNNTLFKNKKILVEHSSPNLFKPFHIGHLMNNTVGESITRLAMNSSAHVHTMSFPSDISLGVAKAIFVLLENKDADLNNVSVLGNAYTEGVKRYDEDESIQNRVKEIADNLYAGNSSEELDIYNKCKSVNMDYFSGIVHRLGSDIKDFIYESEAGVAGKNIVKEYTPKVFTESEGAIVYVPNESRKDINTSVFINSQGNPTYEAKDLGLLKMKFDKYNPDLSIFITDNEQAPHFRVVLDAASHINHVWTERSRHITHGRMTLMGKKMSSRLGGVPLVEEILSEVNQDLKEKNADIDSATSDIISIGALKFSILKAQVGKNINFDPDSSLSFEGDSGPYLQYSAVRANSVLEKAKALGLNPQFSNGKEIIDLERIITRFPNIAERATVEWAPHHIVIYLLELAQAFNSWYGNTKIVDENNSDTPHNLAITASVYQTIKNGLNLLGINLPERM